LRQNRKLQLKSQMDEIGGNDAFMGDNIAELAILLERDNGIKGS
jgi:hypothetical protein